MRPHRIRAYDAAGEVIVQMDLPADGPANFQADRPVSYVVFYYYDAAKDSEVVARRDQMSFPPQGDVWVNWT